MKATTYLHPLHSHSVKAYHSNMCCVLSALSTLKLLLGSLYPPLVVEEQHAHRMYPLSSTWGPLLFTEMGYFHLQSTKPDTIGE